MTNELAIAILTGDVLGTIEQTQEAVTMAVRALSQPDVADINVGDAISRQAAISLPVKPKEDRYFQTQNLDDAYDYGWYSLQRCIEKLPSAQLYSDDEIQKMQDLEQAEIQKAYELGKLDAEPHWIPCSERLPEDENRSYWVCTDNG